jgi:ubiquitin-like-specific protease 1C/D
MRKRKKRCTPTSRKRHERTSGPTVELFRYPFSSTGQTTITDCDRNRCKEDYLNDNLVDFLLLYLTKEKFNKPIHEKEVYIFNSFFYTRYLQGVRNANGNINGYDLAYDWVKRFVKKINIFESKYLMIPVPYAMHWSIVLVCNPNKIMANGVKDSESYFCLYHFDSLGIHNTKETAENIIAYLLKAWHEKNNNLLRLNYDRKIQLAESSCITPPIPKQCDETSCGMFVCLYVEHFLRHMVKTKFPRVTKKRFIKKEYSAVFGMKFKRSGLSYYPWFQTTATEARNQLFQLINENII